MRDNEHSKEILFDCPDSGLELYDSQFLLRKDGLILNTEGWFHKTDFVLCEALYIPSDSGPKTILGERYTKCTLRPGTNEPIPYSLRPSILGAYDPTLNQYSKNEFFAKYKHWIPVDDIAAVFSQPDSLKLLANSGISNLHKTITVGLNAVEADIPLVTKLWGLTGAPGMGSLTALHDLDVVFKGSMSEISQIVTAINRHLLLGRANRISEGGKSWRIRFVDLESNYLFCCFFQYETPQNCPRRSFSEEMIVESVVVHGQVVDDTHASYTPTIVRIRVDESSCPKYLIRHDFIDVVIYHTATRGELSTGDMIEVVGALVMHRGENFENLSLCVNEREAVRNLTPPWLPYYE